MEFKDCPQCGKDNRPTAKFCIACGTSFDQAKGPDTKPLPKPKLTTNTLSKWNNLVGVFLNPIQVFIAVLGFVVALMTLCISYPALSELMLPLFPFAPMATPSQTPNAPKPTFSPTPTELITTKTPIPSDFLDDFSVVSSLWDTSADPTPSRGYEDEQYFIYIDEGHKWAQQILDREMYLYLNADIEVDTWSETETVGGHGIIVRYLAEDRFYLARIDSYSKSLKFIEYEFTDGDWQYTTLHEYNRPDVINGVGEINHLQVIVQGDEIEAYVNNTLIGSAGDIDLAAGRVGFYNCTCDGDGSSTAYYDNFSVKPLP